MLRRVAAFDALAVSHAQSLVVVAPLY
jgi:hypothetical protein